MMFTYWPPSKHCFICPPNHHHHHYHPSSSLPLRCAISLGDLPDHIFLQILNDQKQIIGNSQHQSTSSSSSSSTQSFPQYNKIMKSTIMSDEKLNEEWEGNDNRIEILQKRTSQKSVGTQTVNNNIPFKIEEEEFEDNEEDSKIICAQIAQSLLDIADRWAQQQQEIPTKSFWLFGWLKMKVFRFFG
ncbi:unnamed protein product [Meloidogyne enterolobii]|uniref:Uncharacterized protein n=1 Tax=Meloidogyne enterolobii TaxID=390850 RepID=A0ACB0YUM7_MELEN